MLPVKMIDQQRKWLIGTCYKLMLRKERIGHFVVTNIKGYLSVNKHSYAVMNSIHHVTILDFLTNGEKAFTRKYRC